EGFETKNISMDTPKDVNALAVRMAIMEARIDMPLFDPFVDEIMNLYHDIALRKVDHVAGKNKDTFDAVGGVICSIGLEDIVEVVLSPSKTKPEVVMGISMKKRNIANSDQ